MAGGDEFDGKGTIWVHDSPVGAPERNESAPAASAPAPAPPPGPAVSSPPPVMPAPVPAKRSGFGSTGCLVAVFALGGISLGLVLLLGIGVVGAAWYWQMSGM